MYIDQRNAKQSARPSYTESTRAQKAAMAFASALVSCSLLGGMLSLFDMLGEAGVTARSSVKPQPSIDGLAVRKVASGPRG